MYFLVSLEKSTDNIMEHSLKFTFMEDITMHIKEVVHNIITFFRSKGLMLYLIAAGIPAALFAMIKLILLTSAGQCIITFLPVSILPFLCLAGISYYFFASHSCILTITNPILIYTFSSAYGFCSYALL